MQKARSLPGVKKAFVASGVRYDLAFADEKHGDEYIRELVANHVGGHLKIAPEHISPGVVRTMKKPGKEMFVRFKELFEKYSDEAGKEQYLIPYFISGHPGCEVKDMVELSDFLDENGWRRFISRRFAFGLPFGEVTPALRFWIPAAVRPRPFGRRSMPARSRPTGPSCRFLRSIGLRNWFAFFAFSPMRSFRRVSSSPR